MKRTESKETESMMVEVLAFLAFVLLAMALAFVTSSKVHAAPVGGHACPAARAAATVGDCEKPLSRILF